MRWDYVKLGLKNLRQRQLRSWLTMIGIFIGIATVVSLISLGAGLKDAVAAQFSSLGTDRLVIQAKGGGFGPPGQGAAVTLTEKDRRVVERSQYVEVAAGRLLKGVIVEFNDKRTSQFLVSLPAEPDQRELILSLQNVRAETGRIPRAGDGYRVALGAEFQNPDTFGRAVSVGDTLRISGQKVEVIGLLTKRGNVQIDGAILMDEDAMRQLVNSPEEYSVMSAQVTDEKDIELAKAAIEKNLRTSRRVKEGREDFTVQTPGSLLDSLNAVIGGVTGVLVGIAFISLIVGGIGIMNTMYTAILERTREIGVMKAVGARNSDILSIFMFESGMLGLLGGIIGVILGIALSQLVVLAGAQVLGPGILQSNVSVSLILGALAFSFFVGLLAGALPAYEAAKLPPVEAFRQ